jgi:hypothetical protein
VPVANLEKLYSFWKTIWIVLFISLSIWSYIVTMGPYFMDPIGPGHGFDDDIRMDVMALATHIVTSVTVAGMLQVHWNRPYYWLSFFFLFLLYKDISHLVEFSGFSKAQRFDKTHAMWICGIVLASYQTLLTLGACICYALILISSSGSEKDAYGKMKKREENEFLDAPILF